MLPLMLPDPFDASKTNKPDPFDAFDAQFGNKIIIDPGNAKFDPAPVLAVGHHPDLTAAGCGKGTVPFDGPFLKQ